MPAAPYSYSLDLSEADADDITERLVAYNHAHAPTPTGETPAAQPLHVFARTPDGHLLAGLIARTHAIPSWLEISILWVDEIARHHGVGRELMARAEEEARRRGCRFARLATSDYQAPHLYPKLGYILYGELADCPPGETVYYFRKAL